MNWLILFGTTWLYQVILGATFARVFDASLFPRLSLLWVCVLADRAASSPARETETWLSGLFAACFLGYMLDVHFVAPRGMHMSLYGLSFIAVRLLVTRLGQARRVVKLVLLAGICLGADVTTWWVKGLSLGFANFSQFDLVPHLIRALVTGIFGALLFGPMSRLFAEREGGSFGRL
ncbi:MAG: hypothetical protein IT381_18590 [Deltaproteobacteria bacterium]|nr:hypothetical protein [Deltaproteobacteria bacterium]